MLLELERRRVIEAARQARRDRLVPLTFGNFSVRDRDTGYICITPSGMDYDCLVPEDIVVIDVAGNRLDGGRKPSIETPLHCRIYQSRADIMAIVHTHSTFATAWACCRESIPAVVAEVAMVAGGPIECAPYRPVGSVELGEVAAETLRDRNAVLLANHGVLAVGRNMDEAYVNAVVVEEGAKIAFYARHIGPVCAIGDDECLALRRTAVTKYGQQARP
ncbi:MAG: class II aldolase/adducin family protein [Firmicutes bacterium]|nr:class II aldolase/adducin family protein [Bacillota bacterium]